MNSFQNLYVSIILVLHLGRKRANIITTLLLSITALAIGILQISLMCLHTRRCVHVFASVPNSVYIHSSWYHV